MLGEVCFDKVEPTASSFCSANEIELMSVPWINPGTLKNIGNDIIGLH